MDKKGSFAYGNQQSSYLCFVNFITKISQVISVQQKHKKQKYMQTEMQSLQNEELFNASVELLKQTLDIDDIQFQIECKDIKFVSYIKCIEHVGIMLSKYYQQREQDLSHDLRSMKDKNTDYQQKLTNYMHQNQDLKEIIEHLENERKAYDQKLNNSQHEIERGKTQFFNELSANEYLLKQNEQIKRFNENLQLQNLSLKAILEEAQRKASASDDGLKHLNAEFFRVRKNLQKLNQQCMKLKQDKFCAEKQVQSLQLLIEQKDYIISDKVQMFSEEFSHSAEHNYPYYLNSTKVVRQENQEYGSDKHIMKGIQCAYKMEPIMMLKFGESRSISEASQKSETSLTVQKMQVDFTNQNENESPQPLRDSNSKQKRTKTDTKLGESSVRKGLNQKSYTKNLKKTQLKASLNNNFVPLNTPIPKQKLAGKQKSMTLKQKRQPQSEQKNLKFQVKNSTAQIKSKYKRFRQNSSVILNSRRKSKQEQEVSIQKGRIQHCQSVEDLYFNDPQRISERQEFQKQIITKRKQIEILKNQNRSVRQLALKQSEKLTQVEHELQEQIERLKNEVSFYKKEFHKAYSEIIQEKSLRRVYQNQLDKAAEQIQKQKIVYDRTAAELTAKCKRYMDEQISVYKQKYEEISTKMRHMEHLMTNSNKQDSDPLLDQQIPGKELKKCKSNSLLYKQVKHHSYNASQQYSQINTFSPNHSKNASIIVVEDEDQQILRDNLNMKIVDQYDFDDQRIYNEENQLNSYQQEDKEVKQQQAQTDFDEEPFSRFSQSLGSKLPDSFEISQLSTLGVKSSEDIFKIRLNIERQEKSKKFKSESVFSLKIQPIWHHLKQNISDFDTLQVSSKINQFFNFTNECFDQIQWFKKTKKLQVVRQYEIQVLSQKEKKDVHSATQMKVQKVYQTLNLQIKLKKDVVNSQTQSSFKKLIKQSVFSEKWLPVRVQTLKISENDKKVKPLSLKYNKLFGFKVTPNPKLMKSSQTQYEINNCKDSFVQVNFLPSEIKTFNDKSMQSQQLCLKSRQMQTQSLGPEQRWLNQVINQEAMLRNKCKNDHNQSFNEDHLNEVLNDMTHSFDLSQHFIETLKKKLLCVHEQLKQIQDKQNDSAQSDGSCVQKAFKGITMDIPINYEDQNSLHTIPRFKSLHFERNVKTSKASTNFSVSTSFDLLSPNHAQAAIPQRTKQIIMQFQQIQEIQSQNVDSLSKIQIQAQNNVKQQEISCLEDSVNKSEDNLDILIRKEVLLECFNLEQVQIKGQSQINSLYFPTKITTEHHQQQYNAVMGSPKHYKIEKPAKRLQNCVKSPKNSKNPRNSNNIALDKDEPKLPQRLKKCLPTSQTSQQLQWLTQQQFQYLGRRFGPKKFEIKQTIDFENQQATDSKVSSDQMERQEFHYNQALSNLNKICQGQILVLVCKKDSPAPEKDSLQNQIECIQQQNDRDDFEQNDIIVLSSRKIVSLKNRYILNLTKQIQCQDAERLILGNHEVILKKNQLKFALKNKINFFSWHFPPFIRPSKIEELKQKLFHIDKIIRIRIR